MPSSSRPNPEVLATVLRTLRYNSRTTTELEALTGLSEVTIRGAIKELSQRDLVTSVGKGPSTGGRRPTVYGLNGKAKLVVGIHVELPSLHVVVTDLNGNVVDGPHHVLNYDFKPQEAIKTIYGVARRVEADFGKERVIGLGLALPGYFDSSGTILAVEREPGWSNVPLTARLRQELNWRVLPINDVDCMAQAEIDLDPSITNMDFVYLGFTKGGTKASLFLDGELYSGPFGNAGNIGHTVVRPNGDTCGCGNQGCLETIASVRAVCDAYTEASREAPSGGEVKREIDAISDPRERFEAILRGAEDGEPVCSAVVHQALVYLGRALGNLINLFQVRLVLLGGALSEIPSGLRMDLDACTRQTITPLLKHYVMTLKCAQNKRRCSAALGAASCFVEHYLSRIIQHQLA